MNNYPLNPSVQLLAKLGRPQRLLVPDLPRRWLMRAIAAK